MAVLKYTRDHECVYVEEEIVFVGLSAYAREALGDLVFIGMPVVGKRFETRDVVAVIESVKTAAEVYAPVAGEVVAVNEDMVKRLELLSEPAYERGWIFKIKVADQSALDDLMDEEAYARYLEEVD
ncbi:MAG: glycine cleavage system protein GcvH [Alphaproteobacteria bacterium]